MNNITLPRKDSDGKYYISYSQLNTWDSLKGFNTGKSGKEEYIRQYFLGEKFEDVTGFGVFGSEVEDYICNRNNANVFSDTEKETMHKIIPLGVFQHEFKLPFEGFHVLGYIDDANKTFTRIRDYKTCSEKSKAKYYEPDYKQLDIYALAVKQFTGKLPKQLEVCGIERTGNGFRGGRKVMSVGENIWYIDRKVDKERLKDIEQWIIDTTKEISDYYKVFLKLNQI